MDGSTMFWMVMVLALALGGAVALGGEVRAVRQRPEAGDDGCGAEFGSGFEERSEERSG